MSATLLGLNEVSAAYGPIQALHGVSLEVPEGAVVALLGANGAGKTTTLRAISGMVKTTGGISFDGRDISRAKPEDVARLGIAHVPSGRGIMAQLTVWENLQMGAYTRRDRAGISADVERSFGLFPRLKERSTQLAGTLSGGEQQMLAIGRALMARPKLLMLDEPSLGLAPILVETIFTIIREINSQGTPVLLVEQNAHKALEVAHRGYVLETGVIVQTGTGKELLESEAVQTAYLGI
jgi:branched-chain amino acid transport system ATP-binding protein